jgi:hypothetical protein
MAGVARDPGPAPVAFSPDLGYVAVDPEIREIVTRSLHV